MEKSYLIALSICALFIIALSIVIAISRNRMLFRREVDIYFNYIYDLSRNGVPQSQWRNPLPTCLGLGYGEKQIREAAIKRLREVTDG